MISVLTVDDNSIHCYAISKLLRRKGFSVAMANTGNDALQVVALAKPDVVLLDINLPDVSGYEVCQRLRADPATKDIAVVFHTASTSNEVNRQRAWQAGGDAFLTYPVDQEHLYTVIQGCVARHLRRPS